MNKIIAKIIATILSVITFVNTIPVFAASPSLTNEKNTNTTVGLGTTNTNVYLNVADNNIIVSTPTTIILDSKFDENGNNVGKYSIKVKGDVSGDKILTVEPDNTKILLNQKGKESTSANINQVKTTFTSAELSKETITTGTITSETLTAGSWNSSFNFNIEIKSMYHYYSSIELAVKDANNGNYDNADIENADDPQAIAGLINTSAGANICMLNNENNCNSLVLSKNTNFYLGGHTIRFASGNNITYEKNLNISNGNILGHDVAGGLIKSPKENTDSTMIIENLNLNLICTSNLTKSTYAIDNSGTKNTINNLTVKCSGDGNSAYSCNGLSFRNEKGINEVNNYQFNSTIKVGQTIRAGQIFGIHNTFTRPTLYIDAISASACQGLVFYSPNGEITINGANIYASCEKAKQGSGLLVYNNNDLIINSTQEFPVRIYGKQWCIQSSPFGKTTINGGIYTSTNHTGYIAGNADIYDAEFYITNRDKYEQKYLDYPFGLYFGGSKSTGDAVVNLYRCKIGQGKFMPENTVVAKRNDGNKSPRDVNFYDCELYKGLNSIFSYNYPSKDNLGNTRFNLYGKTKLLSRDGIEITKDISAPLIANWKNTYMPPYWDKNYLIGNWLVNGYVGNINPETNEVIEVFLLEDATVYDYR